MNEQKYISSKAMLQIQQKEHKSKDWVGFIQSQHGFLTETLWVGWGILIKKL